MKLPIIDADGHVVEPFSLWQERMPREFHNIMWRREVDADGQEVLFHGGSRLNIEWTTGSLSTPGAIRDGGRLDIDIDTEVDAGVYDPLRRLALMDKQGIAVSVLFPSMMLGMVDVHDERMQVAYAEVYNDWIAEFCAVDPIRLRWGAVVPTENVTECVRVARAAIAAGASAIMVPPILNSRQTPVSDESLDDLYALLAVSGIPLVVHAINPANRGLAIANHLRGRVQWQMGYSFQNQLATLHVFDSNLAERHPGLRIGFFEGDIGWVQHWFERLDETFLKMALVSKPRMCRVVEEFRKFAVMSADMNDPMLAEAVEYLGSESVLFASDWPHHDGTFPDPIAGVRDNPKLSDRQKRDIFVHAPARFFGIDIAEAIGHIGNDLWSLDAALDQIPSLLDG